MKYNFGLEIWGLEMTTSGGKTRRLLREKRRVKAPQKKVNFFFRGD